MRLIYLGLFCFVFSVFFGFLTVLATAMNPAAAVPLLVLGSNLCGLGMLLIIAHYVVRNWATIKETLPKIKAWIDSNLS